MDEACRQRKVEKTRDTGVEEKEAATGVEEGGEAQSVL